MRPHRRQPTSLLHPWDFPGKNTGVGYHCLLHDQPKQHIKKQRHYFANKVHLVEDMVFPVVMCGCESWTIKKVNAEELMLLNCGIGEDS